MTETIAVPAEAEVIELNLGGRKLMLRMNGNVLEVSAECDIDIRSGSALRLSGASGVKISCGESVLELAPGAASVTSGKVSAQARMAECEGHEIRLKADLLRISCAKLERIAGRVLEYARESYQRVDNLLHTRAGRIRSESQSNLSLHGATVRVDAIEDVRIMGEKIHLR